MSELQVMGKSGHTTVKWDPDNDAEVKTARATFDALIDKGFSAFAVKGKDDKGEKLRRFDPTASEIILIPPIAGG